MKKKLGIRLFNLLLITCYLLLGCENPFWPEAKVKIDNPTPCECTNENDCNCTDCECSECEEIVVSCECDDDCDDPDCECGCEEIIVDPCATSHTPGAAATCTTAQICTVCNYEIAAAIGHLAPNGTEATCTQDGNTGTGTCTRDGCNETVSGTVIDARGHTNGSVATCTTAQTCTVCYEVIVAALNHDFTVSIPALAATCITAGYTAYNKCSRCDEVSGKTIIDALEHNFTGSWQYDATHHWKVCARVNCDEEDVKVAHNFVSEVCNLCSYRKTYTVTVNNGTGGGSYAAGATVNITATVPDGQRFNTWTVNSGGAALRNISLGKTTFTMPANAVTVTASFTIASYSVGSTGPGGGKIYYFDPYGFTVQMVNSPENYTAHYLEAAPANAHTSFVQWASRYGDLIPDLSQNSSDQTDWGIGRGRKNTAIIIAHGAANGYTTPAASACTALTTGGQSDWFLPRSLSDFGKK